MADAATGPGVVCAVMAFCLVGILCLLDGLPVGSVLVRAALGGLVFGCVAELSMCLGSAVLDLGLRDAEDRQNQSDE
jgi:hypothetical protein